MNTTFSSKNILKLHNLFKLDSRETSANMNMTHNTEVWNFENSTINIQIHIIIEKQKLSGERMA